MALRDGIYVFSLVFGIVKLNVDPCPNILLTNFGAFKVSEIIRTRLMD
jgi:hypothetical protein